MKRKRKPEVPVVKSLSLSDSQRLLFAFNPVFTLRGKRGEKKEMEEYGKESGRGDQLKVIRQKAFAGSNVVASYGSWYCVFSFKLNCLRVNQTSEGENDN